MRLLLLAAFLVGCDCSAEVIDALPDGGMSAPYCAQECDLTSDCPAKQHCSLHPQGEHGICFPDLNPPAK